MKNIFGLKITDKAIKMIEVYLNTKIDNLDEKELKEIIVKMKNGVDYSCWAIKLESDSSNTYVWNYKENSEIADLKDEKGTRTLFTVSELNIYLSKYLESEEFEVVGETGDLGWFTNKYFDKNKGFENNFRSLDFKYCSESFYELLKEAFGEVDTHPTIERIGNDSGKDVYKIGEKIFYLIDYCHDLGRKHDYRLSEVNEKCYKRFGYSQPDILDNSQEYK